MAIHGNNAVPAPINTSQYDNALGTYVAGTDKTLKEVSDLSDGKQGVIATVGSETLEFAYAEIDSANKLVQGVTEDGRLVQLGAIEEHNTEANTHDLVFAELDGNGRLIRGIRANGQFISAGRPDEYGAELTHILGGGQSLGTGSDSTPALSTTQPFENLTFSSTAMTAFTALTEPVEGTSLDHGQASETLHSGLANLLSVLARMSTLRTDPMRTLHSTHAQGGAGIATLKKGSAAYTTGQNQVIAGRNLAAARGWSYRVGALVWTHGENDHNAGTSAATYTKELIQLASDFRSDVYNLTGQPDLPAFLITQMGSFTWYGSTTSVIPQAQLDAALARPNEIYLVGPKYQMDYNSSNPTNVGLHLSNIGERHLGEMNAKVLDWILVKRKMWLPLHPVYVERNAAVIKLYMHVPVGPLALDTTLVSNPGNYGFEYFDDSGSPPAISSVAVSGHIVTITLASTPTGANKRVRYAHTGTAGAPAGPTTGARGNLRDSDATISLSGNPLYNWCVHFNLPVS